MAGARSRNSDLPGIHGAAWRGRGARGAGQWSGGSQMMTESVTANWTRANQRYLIAALALLKNRLERYKREGSDVTDQPPMLQRALQEAEAALPAPASLATLCETFDLSSFER